MKGLLLYIKKDNSANENTNHSVYYPCYFELFLFRDRFQILYLTLSKFKEINWPLLPLKSSEKHRWKTMISWGIKVN